MRVRVRGRGRQITALTAQVEQLRAEEGATLAAELQEARAAITEARERNRVPPKRLAAIERAMAGLQVADAARAECVDAVGVQYMP